MKIFLYLQEKACRNIMEGVHVQNFSQEKVWYFADPPSDLKQKFIPIFLNFKKFS